MLQFCPSVESMCISDANALKDIMTKELAVLMTCDERTEVVDNG